MTETPNPNIIDADTLTGEMRPIRRAVLSLGSNLGERMDYLQGAVRALADTPEVWVTGVSPVYETEPVDCPPDAKTFLNAVVLMDTTLAASRLMDRALAIEDAFERERSEVKNAPRTLDVDLIETLAQRIAGVCLLDDRVEWVRVTVHKPDAPIDASFSDVALTITRKGRP